MAIDKVTASFTCTAKQPCGDLVQIYMTASQAKQWTDYTPSGQLNFGIVASKPAASFFEPGKKYLLTFESEDAIIEAQEKRQDENEAWESFRSAAIKPHYNPYKISERRDFITSL